MSDYTYTRNASAELELHDGEIAVRFCDANVTQWEIPIGSLSDYEDDDALVDEISTLIEDHADELARSIVQDLRERVLRDGKAGAR